MYGKAGESDQALNAYRKARAARIAAADPNPAPADPPPADTTGAAGGPVPGSGGNPPADGHQPPPDLTEHRQAAAQHAVAALKDLALAIEAEIDAGADPDEATHMAADWLNDDAIPTVLGLA